MYEMKSTFGQIQMEGYPFKWVQDHSFSVTIGKTITTFLSDIVVWSAMFMFNEVTCHLRNESIVIKIIEIEREGGGALSSIGTACRSSMGVKNLSTHLTTSISLARNIKDVVPYCLSTMLKDNIFFSALCNHRETSLENRIDL